MSKAIKIIKENKFLIFISLVVLLVAFLPLFTVNCINGHDLEYHLLRIESLKEGILSGNPFLKVNMLYFGGRGYASSLFYPDFLLYIPALLRCMGISINASFHLFVAVCIILSFAFMYYCVTKILLNISKANNLENIRLAGVVAAVVYVLAQYHIDDIYTRSAVGEYTAMIFLPFVMYGLYDLIWGEMRRPFMTVIGVAGVLLCHTNTLVFVIGVYVLVFIGVLITRRLKTDSFLRLVKAAIMTLLLTAFYYVPMVEQFLKGRFQTGAGGFDLDYEKLLLRDVFVNKNPALGIALPVTLLVAGLFAHILRFHKEDMDIIPINLGDMMSALAVLFTLCSTGFLPWKRLQRILSFVQFPWRLFIMATVFMSVAVAMYVFYIVKCAAKGQILSLGVLVIISAVMIISAVGNISRIDEGYYSYSNDYYSYVPHTGSVIGGEWLPEAVIDRDALLKNCDEAVTDLGDTLMVSRTANSLKVDISEVNAGYIDVPFIYYAGYAATDAEGSELTVSGEGINGSVRVYLDRAAKGEIEVYYAGTLLQKLASMLSLVTLFVLAFFGIKGKGQTK